MLSMVAAKLVSVEMLGGCEGRNIRTNHCVTETSPSTKSTLNLNAISIAYSIPSNTVVPWFIFAILTTAVLIENIKNLGKSLNLTTPTIHFLLRPLSAAEGCRVDLLNLPFPRFFD